LLIRRSTDRSIIDRLFHFSLSSSQPAWSHQSTTLYHPKPSSPSSSSFNQVFRLRVVCRHWKEIIDENKPFWQVLVIRRKESREWKWNQSILDLFDERSSSTLKEVSLRVFAGEEAEFNVVREEIELP